MPLLEQTKYQVAVPVMAVDMAEAQQKAQHLAQLSVLSCGTLKLLADKSKKPGIEKKLQKYKSMI